MEGAKSISQLTCPALLVLRSNVERNLRRMRKTAAERKVALRPHVKTHKTREGALMQTEGQPRRAVVVSTLAEAHHLLRTREKGGSASISDILYAVPISPDRFEDAAKLALAMDAFHVLTDNEGVVAALDAFAKARGLTFSVFLKVDTGYHRHGVDPFAPASIALAKQIHDAVSLSLAGVYSHSGHSYNCATKAKLAAVAEEEVVSISLFVDAVEAAGVPVPVVSVGATPSFSFLPTDMRRVTELHPGNNIFYDLTQVALGVCTIDDVAVRVLARVVGHYPARNTMIINAGALALSKDLGAQHKGSVGYGTIEGHENLVIQKSSQEVSIVTTLDGSPLDYGVFPIGFALKILPNHSCLTAANFSSYYVVDESDAVVDVWHPCRGW